MNESEIGTLSPVRFVDIADASRINAALLTAFTREKRAGELRQTHHFHGRYENTYIDRQRLPELDPVCDTALNLARSLLAIERPHFGFWFNEMQPGQRTSLHSHEELDELLSVVYYVTSPQDSGNLVLHDDHATIIVTPRPGLLVAFPPDLPHEVETNRSGATRLSVAFNFGPQDAAN